MDSDGVVELGVAGALAKEIRKDSEMFLEFFVQTVQTAFPDHAKLQYEGSFLSKKRLVGVAVELGDGKYTLTRGKSGQLSATRVHVVRGIALKTESVEVGEWLNEVSAKIEEMLARNERARKALAATLGLH